MNCWLLYSKDDVEKNKLFIDLLRNNLSYQKIDSELVLVEDLKYKNRPDVVINRSRDYHAAQRLESNGVKVINSSKVTRVCNNKAKTYKILEGVVPFLPYEYREEVIGAEEVGYPCVIKSIAGHGGNEVFLVKDKEEEKSKGLKDYIRQVIADTPERDVRVYILGGEIIAAVERRAQSGFKSNYSLGGSVKLIEPTEEMKNIVDKINEILTIDYAGIDLMYNKNKLVLNEIEDAAGARMLYEASDIDIAQMLAQYVKELG